MNLLEKLFQRSDSADPAIAALAAPEPSEAERLRAIIDELHQTDAALADATREESIFLELIGTWSEPR